jgi:hypothetical protein
LPHSSAILRLLSSKTTGRKMNSILSMILRRLVNLGMSRVPVKAGAMTPEQKEAHKRVRQAMKATRRMHRI